MKAEPLASWRRKGHNPGAWTEATAGGAGPGLCICRGHGHCWPVPGVVLARGESCVLSASSKSTWSLWVLWGQRVGEAVGMWGLSWGAGGGPGSSKPALPLALWASVSSSVKWGMG